MDAVFTGSVGAGSVGGWVGGAVVTGAVAAGAVVSTDGVGSKLHPHSRQQSMQINKKFRKWDFSIVIELPFPYFFTLSYHIPQDFAI